MRFSKIMVLVTATAMIVTGQVSGNLITNGGFEDPIGTEWAYTRVSGSATSWSYGRSNAVVRSGAYSYMLKFGSIAEMGKSYVEQVVSGLTPGDFYAISGWIYMDWRATKATAFIQVLGGGDPVQAPEQGKNTDDTWEQWALSQMADSSGNLTVRFYLDKYATTTADKTAIAYFDDIVVTPEPMVALLLALSGLALTPRRRSTP